MGIGWQIVITVFSSVLASSGLWAFILKKSERNDARTKMLIGLAHDRLVTLGMQYIHRGFITHDEYEDFREYIYEPYKGLGGNGSGDRIMFEVDKLPIRDNFYRRIEEKYED